MAKTTSGSEKDEGVLEDLQATILTFWAVHREVDFDKYNEMPVQAVLKKLGAFSVSLDRNEFLDLALRPNEIETSDSIYAIGG